MVVWRVLRCRWFVVLDRIKETEGHEGRLKEGRVIGRSIIYGIAVQLGSCVTVTGESSTINPVLGLD